MLEPVRRVWPEPGVETTVEEAYAGPLGRHGDRPWLAMCMVTSIDGSIAVAGTSGGLSSPTDTAVLARLRRLADVSIVGSGTVREEGYGAPTRPGRRLGVVTASGRVDVDGDLFRSGAGFVITTEDAPELPTGVDVVRAGRGRVDLALALRSLDTVAEVGDVVLAEGGAALNGALLAADLVDEIDVTTSPASVGGGGPRLATSDVEHLHRFEAAQVALDDEGFVYTRWRRRR